MGSNTLNSGFKEISEQIQKAVADDPALSAMIGVLLVMFESQSALNNSQSEQIKSQSEQIKSQSELIESQSSEIKQLTKRIETLTLTIERLSAKLGNKSITVRKTTNENINGKGSERKKGIDSSSKEKKQKEKKEVPVNDDVSVTDKEVCIDIDGKELSLEEAKKKVGTVFTGKDGRRYKYVRINDSSEKIDIDISVRHTRYSKLQVVAVDENGNEISEVKVTPTVYPETDFLKKSSMSIGLMSLILEQWLVLKSPLNRISQYLLRYNISYSRQQLYSYTDTTAALLMPIFKHMESYLKEATFIGVDETYWSCREKGKIKGPPEDEPGRKSHRSKSKTLRSYVFGIVSKTVCLYYHSLERSADIPKNIILDNQVSADCFIESDAFYRKMFSIKKDKDGHSSRVFSHGICWVHGRRNFCELVNYGTHKNGSPIQEIIDNHWEQDIEDARYFIESITNCFKVHNTLVEKCIKNEKQDICELKSKELTPLIDKIFDKAKAIYKTIKKERANSKEKQNAEPVRKCSDRLYKAIVYMVNNEDRLKAFLSSPYGVMTNNATEEKFRELDLLRNGMIASDTCKGASNLTEFYSLYKTCLLHNTDFRTYMKTIITTMMLHVNEIEFEKDAKGTITGYKSHKISTEILDKLMPWNMA